MIHCLSETVTVTVNVEGCGGTSVRQQCHSSAGIGGPRWYVPATENERSEPEPARTLSRLRPYYTVVARLQPSAASMAEYRSLCRPPVDCPDIHQIAKYIRGISSKNRSRPHGITAKIIPVTVVTAGFFLISVSTPAGLYPLLHPCKSLI